MSHESTIFLLAIIIALVPFLGLPYSWLMVIVPVLALLLAFFAGVARARRLGEVHAPAPRTSYEEVIEE